MIKNGRYCVDGTVQTKKIKKNIKNVIYDYEFWKKAVIIDTKLALLCVREKTGQSVAFLQI